MDGPCCTLQVLTLSEFIASLSALSTMENHSGEGIEFGFFRLIDVEQCSLRDYIISEIKYNYPMVERIIEYDELYSL